MTGRGAQPAQARLGGVSPGAVLAPVRKAWAGLSATTKARQRIIVWGGLIVAWQIFGMLAGPFFFASFTDTIKGGYELAVDGSLAPLGESLRQLLIGFGLAALVGIPAGIFIGWSWIGEATLGLYVRALLVTSLEALIPFLIILAGSEFKFRVVVVFLFAVLYITLNTTAGVRDVDRGFIETARSFGASRLQLARKVVLVAAIPYVFAGLRLGWGFSVKGMVIAELWVATGTGKVLIDLGGNRELDKYFALALLIVSIGAIGSWILRTIQKRIAPWAAISTGVRGTGR